MSRRPTSSTATRPRWAHVRAALVLLHVFAVVVLALPRPHSVTNRRAYKSANAQSEFRQWSARLNRVGFETSPPELERDLWSFANRYAEVHRSATKPMEHYGDLAGTRQGWSMFASPQRHPAELHVEIRRDKEWVTITRPRSGEHAWLRWKLDHNRVRKLLGRFARTFYPDRYRAFARWLATQAAHDHPDALLIRVRLVRYHSLPADRVRAGEVPQGRTEHPLVFVAEELRKESAR